MKPKLPALILHAKAKHPLPKLPKGNQPMLDETRAKEVSRLQQRVANLKKRIELVSIVDSSALSAAVLPGLERDLADATKELTEALNSYGATNG
jgi:hypothetical protein